MGIRGTPAQISLAGEGRQIKHNVQRTSLPDIDEARLREYFKARGFSRYPRVNGGSQRIHYRAKNSMQFITDHEDVNVESSKQDDDNNLNVHDWSQAIVASATQHGHSKKAARKALPSDHALFVKQSELASQRRAESDVRIRQQLSKALNRVRYLIRREKQSIRISYCLQYGKALAFALRPLEYTYYTTKMTMMWFMIMTQI